MSRTLRTRCLFKDRGRGGEWYKERRNFGVTRVVEYEARKPEPGSTES